MEGYASESNKEDQFGNSQFGFEDLVHNDEEIQDSALKDFYSKAKVQDETQKKVMEVLIFFSRRFTVVFGESQLYIDTNFWQVEISHGCSDL